MQARTIAILFLIAAAVVAPCQTITYTTRAEPLSRALADISAAAKKKLICSNDIENEPIILKLNQVPLKTVMDKIALVTAGEWVQQSDGPLLQRGKEADAEHHQALKSRADDLEAAIDKELAANTDLQIADQDAADRVFATNQKDLNGISLLFYGRAQRLILQIVKKIDPSEIVDVPDGTRLVWSNKPNANQKQLPEVDDLVSAFIDSQNLLDNAIPRSSLPDSTKKMLEQHFSPASGNPSLIIFSIDYGMSSNHSASLNLYDDSGDLIAGYAANISGGFDFTSHRKKEQAVRQKAEQGIRLGPQAEEIVPYILSPTIRPSRPLSDEVQNLLATPTTADPLSIATSDLVLGFADQDNVNVAYIPTDLGESWAYIASRGGLADLPLFEQVLQRANETQVTEDDAWMIGKPTDPIAATQERISRPALETFVKQMLDKKYVDTYDIADLAQSGTMITQPVLATYDVQVLVGTNTQLWGWRSDWDIKAFLATLNGDQRNAAAQGTLTLDPSQLGRDQTDLLLDWALMAGTLQFAPAPPVQPPALPAPPPPMAIGNEPTVTLADGFPLGTRFEITDRLTTMYHLPTTGEDFDDSPCTIEDLARYAVQAQHPDPTNDLHYDFNSIGIGQERTIDIRAILPNTLQVDDAIDEHRPPLNRLKMADLIAGLSPDDRAKFDAATELAKKQYNDAGGQPAEPTATPPTAS